MRYLAPQLTTGTAKLIAAPNWKGNPVLTKSIAAGRAICCGQLNLNSCFRLMMRHESKGFPCPRGADGWLCHSHVWPSLDIGILKSRGSRQQSATSRRTRRRMNDDKEH